jgi:hypothetical protein
MVCNSFILIEEACNPFLNQGLVTISFVSHAKPKQPKLDQFDFGITAQMKSPAILRPGFLYSYSYCSWFAEIIGH